MIGVEAILAAWRAGWTGKKDQSDEDTKKKKPSEDYIRTEEGRNIDEIHNRMWFV